MRTAGYGFHFPLVWGADIPRVWGLRTAGLGVLSNMPGDAKPVSVIEDTAVPVHLLPDYLAEFGELMKRMKLESVYHAHIATGELHLRPILNLKDKGDVAKFREVATETARLVKKYRGSLSGEHGDGRLRGEFIPFMYGEKVYSLLKELKRAWDPNLLLNPGKICDTPAMDQTLRFEPGQETPLFKNYFDFKLEQGYMRSIEKCNGSGDCRKSELIGGTMCPSFMATRNELHSTRGRANILREFISNPGKLSWADNHDIVSTLELCLSCKACKSECPSGVDMAKLKAEFMQNHYDGNPVPFEVRLIAQYPVIMNLLAKMPKFSNLILQSSFFGGISKSVLGFAPQRSFPKLSEQTVNAFMKRIEVQTTGKNGKIYLFNDEFLNSTDAHIGIKAIRLLERLGYEVLIPHHVQSGRTYLSKGLVKKAQMIALKNVLLLKDFITDETPLIGIEPSAILSFRDEYPDLVPDEWKSTAKALAKNTLMFDEFVVREVAKGQISSEQFSKEPKIIKLHGHCHQKSLATTAAAKQMLSLPVNYKVDEIPSGCCGMAGSFGYEKKHYELSMQIGEMVLFPAVRKAADDMIIAAPGTSCREQIAHGTGRRAVHPIEVLFEALL
jgi:Fe-S oxidoreductase